MTCCLAIDIGASSGRHILGSVENGKIVLTEIYRFENGTLVWDTERLLSEVKNGLKKCREIGKIPKTIAIDTWGVDYVLLNLSIFRLQNLMTKRLKTSKKYAESKSRTSLSSAAEAKINTSTD